ncbi:MAG: hypothetical protein GYA16_09725 [Spirochaetes bacterium]|nr:hypothetical protein [Spirochaetota bacterium]
MQIKRRLSAYPSSLPVLSKKRKDKIEEKDIESIFGETGYVIDEGPELSGISDLYEGIHGIGEGDFAAYSDKAPKPSIDWSKWSIKTVLDWLVKITTLLALIIIWMIALYFIIHAVYTFLFNY